MIILKHGITGDLSFVSHKDILKALQRGLKRAKIEVAYSEGFVPHMRTYTTTPLPLGIQSRAEYLCVDCAPIAPQEFLERYNASVPTGLKGVFAVSADRNPNLAAKVVASDYSVRVSGDCRDCVERVMQSAEWKVDFVKNGITTTKEVRNMIFRMEAGEGELQLRLATGNVNLRADAFVKDLCEKFGFVAKTNDIVRTAQLVEINGVFTDAEELIR